MTRALWCSAFLLVSCGSGDPIRDDPPGVPAVPVLPVDTGLASSTTTTATPAGCTGVTRWVGPSVLTDVWTSARGEVFAVGPGAAWRRDEAGAWGADVRWSAADVVWRVAGPRDSDGEGLIAVSPHEVMRRGTDGWSTLTPADWGGADAVAVAALDDDQWVAATIHTSEDAAESVVQWWLGDGDSLTPDGEERFAGGDAVVTWHDDGRRVVGTDAGTVVGGLHLDPRMRCVATDHEGTLAGCGEKDRLFVLTPEGQLETIDTEAVEELETVDRWVAAYVERRDRVYWLGREYPQDDLSEERIVLVRWDATDELSITRMPTVGQQGRAMAHADAGVWVVGGTVGSLAIEAQEVGPVLELDRRGAPGAVARVAIDDLSGEAVGLTTHGTVAVLRDGVWRGSVDLPEGVDIAADAPVAASDGKLLVPGLDGVLVSWSTGGFGISEVGTTSFGPVAAAGGTLFAARGSEVRASGDTAWNELPADGLPAGSSVLALWADGPEALVAVGSSDDGAFLSAWDGTAWSGSATLPDLPRSVVRGGDGRLWLALADGSVHTWSEGEEASQAVAHDLGDVHAAAGSADGSWVGVVLTDEGYVVQDPSGASHTLADPAGFDLAARGGEVQVALPTWGAVWERRCGGRDAR